MLQRPRAVLKWLPYVLPMAMFLVLSMPEQLLGSYGYPAAYTIKIIAITTLLWTLRRFYPELKRNWTGVALSLMLGPLLTLAWIVIDRITPHFSFLGTRSEFDPFEVFSNQPLMWLFIAVRFFGLVIIAPVTEEIFYRAFLLRWIDDTDDFKRVPVGHVSRMSFFGVVLLMASAHPEYLAAAFFSAAMNVLIYRTRNVWATISAHASTNLCLGVYVLCFHQWKYW